MNHTFKQKQRNQNKMFVVKNKYVTEHLKRMCNSLCVLKVSKQKGFFSELKSLRDLFTKKTTSNGTNCQLKLWTKPKEKLLNTFFDIKLFVLHTATRKALQGETRNQCCTICKVERALLRFSYCYFQRV